MYKKIRKIILSVLSISIFLNLYPSSIYAQYNEEIDESRVPSELLDVEVTLEDDTRTTLSKYNIDGNIVYFKVYEDTIETFDEDMNSMGSVTVELVYHDISLPNITSIETRAVWDSYDTWAGYLPYVDVRISLTPAEIALGITVGLIYAKLKAYLLSIQLVIEDVIIDSAAQTILTNVITNNVIKTSVMYNYNTQCNILRRETIAVSRGYAAGYKPLDESEHQIYWTANPNDYTQPTACRMLKQNPDYRY